jgi:outer membrane protein OmpA-like peptidoglycan-associated protein
MKRNKSITIELSSHTDSRASESYNNDLSQKRAQSCYDYIVSKGISSDRVRPKGYGESKLLNECKDGIECDEQQHQKNRRTEIEILRYTPIECEPIMDMDFKNKDLVLDADDKK